MAGSVSLNPHIHNEYYNNHPNLDGNHCISDENNNKQGLSSKHLSLALLGLATLSTALLLKKNNIGNRIQIKKQIEAPWYTEYRNLCEKFNIKVRECGKVGGAADHYQELLLKNNNPAEYQKYLKERAMRATTEEKARVLEELDRANLNI